mgnify:CR=1 FL=1
MRAIEGIVEFAMLVVLVLLAGLVAIIYVAMYIAMLAVAMMFLFWPLVVAGVLMYNGMIILSVLCVFAQAGWFMWACSLEKPK